MRAGAKFKFKNIRGTVVTYEYPYSDSTQSKKRPVFVIVEVDDEDFIACRISTTPKGKRDKHSIEITNDDFEWGGLSEPNSKVHIYSISTLLKSKIRVVCGKLKEEKQEEIIGKILGLISGKNS